MSSIGTIGRMNGPAAGVILRVAMWRAMSEARKQRHDFETGEKEGVDGKDDVYTSADVTAQDLMKKILMECFPDAGVIGEEGKLHVLPKNGCKVWIVFDPIDGTRAFIRGQSRGVGCMVALIEDGVVLAAYVGDIFTGDIVGYRPGSDKVHCLFDDGKSRLLVPPTRPLHDAYVLLRDPPHKYSDLSNATLRRFRSFDVEGGSIGMWMTRLWRGECGALIMRPSKADHPWDVAPIFGISLKLGYAFFRPGNDGWERYEPYVGTESKPRVHDTLIVHASQATSQLLCPLTTRAA